MLTHIDKACVMTNTDVKDVYKSPIIQPMEREIVSQRGEKSEQEEVSEIIYSLCVCVDVQGRGDAGYVQVLHHAGEELLQ